MPFKLDVVLYCSQEALFSAEQSAAPRDLGHHQCSNYGEERGPGPLSSTIFLGLVEAGAVFSTVRDELERNGFDDKWQKQNLTAVCTDGPQSRFCHKVRSTG